MHKFGTVGRVVIAVLMMAVWCVLDTGHARALDGLVRGAARKVQFSESWFDRTCFGQLTAAMARRRCQELLDKRIELADETVGLGDQRQTKLRAAGQIDIHRFFVQYDLLKTKFKFGDISQPEWQKRVKDVYDQTDPYINRMIAGLNGRASLYEKSLHASLDPASFEKVQEAYADYARKRYATKIDQTLKQVLRNAVDRQVVVPPAVPNPLERLEKQANVDPEQADGQDGKSVRTAVSDVLLSSTEPPEFYGNSRNYINTVINKIMEAETELNGILNEQEIAMFRSLNQMQQPHRRPELRQMRRPLNLQINQLKERR